MASHMKAFMSQGDEATRYMERGAEGTRACWALDEATRILAETEDGTTTKAKFGPCQFIDGYCCQSCQALAESLAAFVEGR